MGLRMFARDEKSCAGLKIRFAWIKNQVRTTLKLTRLAEVAVLGLQSLRELDVVPAHL